MSTPTYKTTECYDPEDNNIKKKKRIVMTIEEKREKHEQE
jgi:hypothetical protein